MVYPRGVKLKAASNQNLIHRLPVSNGYIFNTASLAFPDIIPGSGQISFVALRRDSLIGRLGDPNERIMVPIGQSPIDFFDANASANKFASARRQKNNRHSAVTIILSFEVSSRFELLWELLQSSA